MPKEPSSAVRGHRLCQLFSKADSPSCDSYDGSFVQNIDKKLTCIHLFDLFINIFRLLFLCLLAILTETLEDVYYLYTHTFTVRTEQS